MGAPHNKERYGELWPQYKIDAVLRSIEGLKPYVVVSGGYAWHFMCPAGHTEYKHAHDHKDVDLYLPKTAKATVMGLLPSMGFVRVTTKYDSPTFRRYEQVVEDGRNPPFRMTLDLFDGEVPAIGTPSGWNVVRPDVLLTFYKTHHSSDYCWAVQSATRLLANGETPEGLVGRGDLLACPDLPVYLCTRCGWGGQFPTEFGGKDGKLCPKCPYMVVSTGLPSYRPMKAALEEVEKKLRRG